MTQIIQKRTIFFNLIPSKDVFQINSKDDSYFIKTRNQGVEEKMDWIIKFLKKNKNEKTLIYSQFIDATLKNIPTKELNDETGKIEIVDTRYRHEKLFQKLNSAGYKQIDVFDKDLFDADNMAKMKADKYYGFISGELGQVEKQRIVRLYNEDVIKVLIFTLSIKEGISFKETNNIIVFQPYWNYAIMEQILARGIRYDSHKLKNKSTINLHMLVAYNPEATTGLTKVEVKKNFQKWADYCSNIMNSDIKTLKFDIKKVDKVIPFTEKIIKVNEIQGMDMMFYKTAPIKLTFSRDAKMYNLMFDKQAKINAFEDRLNDVPKFEDANNIDNNEFVQDYNAKLLELESQGKKLTVKFKNQLRREMYKDFYNKNIQKVNKSVIRFLNDSRFQVGKTPTIEDVNKRYEGLSDNEIKKLIKNKVPLDEILQKFGIQKKDITQFQANFTPESEINKVINMSGIKQDNRTDLNILEPTAGIGNFALQLLKLPNANNFLIECNEINNAFFRIGKLTYDNIDNVLWSHMDFMKFVSSRPYDYILGNPPFNLRLTEKQVVSQRFAGSPDVKYDPISQLYFKVLEKQLFDIHFVERAYNMLASNGVLCFIISDRFQRDKQYQVFEIFRKNLEYMKKKVPSSVEIISTKQFKQSEGVSKEMETNFGMVAIKLKKIDNFDIDLGTSGRRTNFILDQSIDKTTKEGKAEIAKMKRDVKKQTEIKPNKTIGLGKDTSNTKFMNELIKMNIKPASYLSVVRMVAEKEGYNPDSIYFSDKPEKKLMILNNEDEKIYFGQTGYGDFIIWNFLENMEVVPNGFSSKKRKLYLARATKIKGNWKKDIYSPNNLAIRILW